MISCATHSINRKLKGDLGVAIDADVAKVGDSDGLNGGGSEAEKGGGGEKLHRVI